MNRWIKIIFALLVAIYMTLVGGTNMVDYGANFQFVKMVVSMDDTFSKAVNGWRGTYNPWVHHALYNIIIGLQLLIAALLWWGAYRMFVYRRAHITAFKTAKKYAAWGMTLGVMLWFFVFVTIGGEWFLMWQSKQWNAQGNAFFLTICFLLFLIFHQMDNDDHP